LIMYGLSIEFFETWDLEIEQIGFEHT